MAVAVAIRARDVSSLRRVIADLTFSGTYTTGGEAPSAGFLKSMEFSKIHFVTLTQTDTGTTTGLVAKYDHTNNKVMLCETAATVDNPLKELTSAASLTNIAFRAEFIGEGNN